MEDLAKLLKVTELMSDDLNMTSDKPLPYPLPLLPFLKETALKDRI